MTLEEPLVMESQPSVFPVDTVLEKLWPEFEFPAALGVPNSGPRARNVVHLDSLGRINSLEFHKHSIIKFLGIRYREAMMLDPLIPIPFPAAILVRERAIIVNCEAVRMIICANQCYVLSVPKVGNLSQAAPPTVDHPFVVFLSNCLAHINDPVYWQSSVQQLGLGSVDDPSWHDGHANKNAAAAAAITGKEFDQDTPYELRALEIALRVVIRALSIECHLLETTGYPALERMSREVNALTLRQVRDLKRDLTDLTKRVETLRAEVDKILKSDHELNDLYLSRRVIEAGLQLPPQPPEAMEQQQQGDGSDGSGGRSSRTTGERDDSGSFSFSSTTSPAAATAAATATATATATAAENTTTTTAGNRGGDKEDGGAGSNAPTRSYGHPTHSPMATMELLPMTSQRALKRTASSLMRAVQAAQAWKRHATMGDDPLQGGVRGGATLQDGMGMSRQQSQQQTTSAGSNNSGGGTTNASLLSPSGSLGRRFAAAAAAAVASAKTGLTADAEVMQSIAEEASAAIEADLAAATLEARRLLPSPTGSHGIDPRTIEAAEDLMESVFLNLDSILRSLNAMTEKISHDELLLRISMDSRRNQLVRLDLLVSCVAMGFGFAAMVAGILGMNTWQSSAPISTSAAFFWWIVAICVIGATVLPCSVIWYLRNRRLDLMFEAAL